MEQNTEKAAPAVEPKKNGKRAKRNGKKRTAARKSGKKPKDGTVKDAAIAMLRKGTTVPALMKAFGWTQPHTARGFISNLGRLHSFKVESSKEEGEVRTYRVR